MDLLLAALRSSIRRPAKTIAATFVVAAAVATATTGYAVIDALLLRPLPFKSPHELAVMSQPLEIHRRLRTEDVRRERERADASPLIAGRAFLRSGALSDQQGPAAGETELVHYEISDDFFSILGVTPFLGRTPTRDDTGSNPIPAVVSYSLWRDQLGGDREIIGRVVELNSARVLVLGVMRPHVVFPVGANIWSAVQRAPQQQPSFVRLKPGITVADLANAFPRLDIYPIERLVRPTHSAGLVLVFVGAIVALVIAIAQLAFLNISSTVAAAPQMWTRMALGATPGRLRLDLGAQAVLITAAGTAAAWAVVPFAIRIMGSALPREILRGQELVADGRVFAFSASLAFMVALASMFVGHRLIQRVTMTAMQPGVLGHSQTRRMSRSILLAQIACTTVLLYLCGLSVRSFSHVAAVDLGIDADTVLLARLPFAGRTVRPGDLDEIERSLAAVPGVASVARSATFPLARGALRGTAVLPGRAEFLPTTVRINYVTPAFFRTLGMRVLSGEGIEDSANTRSAVVNETLARQLALHGGVVGQLIQVTAVRARIVGVVEDVVDNAPDVRSDPHVYVLDAGPLGRTFLIRASGDLAELMPRVRAAFERVPGAQAASVAPFSDYARIATAGYRSRAVVLTSFAIMGTVLSVLGVVASLALAMRQRTREIGLRIALGADSGNIRREVLVGTLATVSAGAALGVVLGALIGSGLRSVLFEMAPIDIGVAATAMAAVTAIAAIAAWFPAGRAARTDPAVALRRA